MGFLSRLFGSRPEPSPPSRPPSTMSQPSSRNATRRELVRVALRDTLTRHGIPGEWIGLDALSAVTRGREPGLHLRLVLRHWEPQLLACAVAIQKSVAQRVLLLDPLAGNWMTGISWQFAPADESACAPLPPAGHWKALQEQAIRASIAARAADAALPEPDTAAGRKAALDRMLGAGHVPGGREAHPEFSDTRPMFGATQPAGL